MQLREFVWTLLYGGLDSITIFPLETQQIEVKLVAIDIEFYSKSTYTPYHFHEHSL